VNFGGHYEGARSGGVCEQGSDHPAIAPAHDGLPCGTSTAERPQGYVGNTSTRHKNAKVCEVANPGVVAQSQSWKLYVNWTLHFCCSLPGI
jgi:hypothetical protein